VANALFYRHMTLGIPTTEQIIIESLKPPVLVFLVCFIALVWSYTDSLDKLWPQSARFVLQAPFLLRCCGLFYLNKC